MAGGDMASVTRVEIALRLARIIRSHVGDPSWSNPQALAISAHLRIGAASGAVIVQLLVDRRYGLPGIVRDSGGVESPRRGQEMHRSWTLSWRFATSPRARICVGPMSRPPAIGGRWRLSENCWRAGEPGGSRRAADRGVSVDPGAPALHDRDHDEAEQHPDSTIANTAKPAQSRQVLSRTCGIAVLALLGRRHRDPVDDRARRRRRSRTARSASHRPRSSAPGQDVPQREAVERGRNPRQRMKRQGISGLRHSRLSVAAVQRARLRTNRSAHEQHDAADQADHDPRAPQAISGSA